MAGARLHFDLHPESPQLHAAGCGPNWLLWRYPPPTTPCAKLPPQHTRATHFGRSSRSRSQISTHQQIGLLFRPVDRRQEGCIEKCKSPELESLRGCSSKTAITAAAEVDIGGGGYGATTRLLLRDPGGGGVWGPQGLETTYPPTHPSTHPPTSTPPKGGGGHIPLLGFPTACRSEVATLQDTRWSPISHDECLSQKCDEKGPVGFEPRTHYPQDHSVNHSTTFLG